MLAYYSEAALGREAGRHVGSAQDSGKWQPAVQRDWRVGHFDHGEAPRIVPRKQFIKYYDEFKPSPSDKKSAKHMASFIDACKGEGRTNSPFSISGKLSQVLALGTIAQCLNTDLEFDPQTKQFIGNDEANVLLNPPPRKEWEPFYNLA